jgi:hypothetical protein
MLSGSLAELSPIFARGPVNDFSNHRLAVRAVKIYADGALGSRGAALLEPYADEPTTTGLLVTPPDEVYAQTLAAAKAGFQVGIHAIVERIDRRWTSSSGCSERCQVPAHCGCESSMHRSSTPRRSRGSRGSL